MNADELINQMRNRIPKDPRTKPYFDKIVAEGVSEKQAVDIMIYAWLKGRIIE